VTSVKERSDLKKLAEPDFMASLRTSPPALVIPMKGKSPEPIGSRSHPS
jgi:hypothetical protein